MKRDAYYGCGHSQAINFLPPVNIGEPIYNREQRRNRTIHGGFGVQTNLEMFDVLRIDHLEVLKPIGRFLTELQMLQKVNGQRVRIWNCLMS